MVPLVLPKYTSLLPSVEPEIVTVSVGAAINGDTELMKGADCPKAKLRPKIIHPKVPNILIIVCSL
jgi:hypothetical protein